MTRDENAPTTPSERPGPYEPPAILWEEELPQGPNVFSACGKVEGAGGQCNAVPGS
jgi:hypothetical protein